MAQTITNISTTQNMLRMLSQASKKEESSFQKLSSGSKINSAKDDAAGLVISQQLLAELTALDQSARNASDGISLVQVADSGLSSVTGALSRIRELSLQAANGTTSAEGRTAIQSEISGLQTHITDTLSRANFNGVDLFNSNTTVNLQVGSKAGDTLSINLQDVGAQLAPVSGIDASTAVGASASLSVIDTALQQVDALRGDLGSLSSRIDSSINNISNTKVNLAEARSRITDTDYATEVSEQVFRSIQRQSTIAMSAHANASPQMVLGLLS